MKYEEDLLCSENINLNSLIKSVYYSSGVLLKPQGFNASFSNKRGVNELIPVKEKEKDNPAQIKNSLKESDISKLWGLKPESIHFAFPDIIYKNISNQQRKKPNGDICSLTHREGGGGGGSLGNLKRNINISDRASSDSLNVKLNKKRIIFNSPKRKQYVGISRKKYIESYLRRSRLINEESLSQDSRELNQILSERTKDCFNKSCSILGIFPSKLVKTNLSHKHKPQEYILIRDNTTHNINPNNSARNLMEFKKSDYFNINNLPNKFSTKLPNSKRLKYSHSQNSIIKEVVPIQKKADELGKNNALFDNLQIKAFIDRVVDNKKQRDDKSKSRTSNIQTQSFHSSIVYSSLNSKYTNYLLSSYYNDKNKMREYMSSDSRVIVLSNPMEWRKHEEIWSNVNDKTKICIDIDRYLIPPNEAESLISSFVTKFPDIMRYCKTSSPPELTQRQNWNPKDLWFIIDNKVENPKLEIKKWKEAYLSVLSRWNYDKITEITNNLSLRGKARGINWKRLSANIINKTNILYQKIIETLRIIYQKQETAKRFNGGNNQKKYLSNY